MNKKFIGIITIAAFIIFLIIVYNIRLNDEELFFAQWDGVFYSPEEDMTINLIGLSKQPLTNLQKNISEVKLNNNELFEIKTTTITSSNDTYKGYTIFTIEIAGILRGPGTETINEISVIFNNKKELFYDIGEIQLISEKMDNILSPGDIHFISYDSTDIYRKELENISDLPLTLKEIQLENNDIDFKNIKINGKLFEGDIIVEPGEEIKIEAEVSSRNNKLLYIVSPKYKYVYDNIEHTFHFDPSVMNVLELKDEQLNYILSR